MTFTTTLFKALQAAEEIEAAQYECESVEFTNKRAKLALANEETLVCADQEITIDENGEFIANGVYAHLLDDDHETLDIAFKLTMRRPFNEADLVSANLPISKEM
jgi:hypothetical protein